MSNLSKTFKLKIKEYLLEKKCLSLLIDVGITHTLKESKELLDHMKIKHSTLSNIFKSYNLTLPTINDYEVQQEFSKFCDLKKIYEIETALALISETQNESKNNEDNIVLKEQALELNKMIKTEKD